MRRSTQSLWQCSGAMGLLAACGVAARQRLRPSGSSELVVGEQVAIAVVDKRTPAAGRSATASGSVQDATATWSLAGNATFVRPLQAHRLLGAQPQFETAGNVEATSRWPGDRTTSSCRVRDYPGQQCAMIGRQRRRPTINAGKRANRRNTDPEPKCVLPDDRHAGARRAQAVRRRVRHRRSVRPRSADRCWTT
jgi:hypothetical protein